MSCGRCSSGRDLPWTARSASRPSRAAMHLNHGQKQDLQISLTIADRAMRLLEALLVIAEAEGAPAPEKPDESAERLRALSREFREAVAGLVDDLGLVREDRDFRPLLVGQIQRARDCVDGSLVSGLAGYGPLDPEAEAYLRPRVAELLLLTREMLRVVGGVRPRSV